MCFSFYSMWSPLDVELGYQGRNPKSVHPYWLESGKWKKWNMVLPGTILGCLVLPFQPPWKVGTNSVISWMKIFDLKRLGDFPRLTKVIRKGAGFERSQLCPLPKLMHLPICHPVRYKLLSESLFLHPWSRDDDIVVPLWVCCCAC